ncbi:alpha/beta hydrolase [Arsenicicoccus dermatophilus]|uniref:alpha/beta hydrolase n=1 Tax=Arsenicicoccus dermatophilus TaxID=1076331 RepID=UPI001F4CEB37|nr:alpha/beta hydrolase [Arsenicicoccus dermatophilus]MCH8612703.1 lysophospholipase [Arsenicicoccus dermatophilus]
MPATRSTLSTHDGVPVTLHEWAPQGRRPRGTVVVAHGMAEHAARYDRLASELVEAGWAVLAPDHRGHGLTTAVEEHGYLGDHDGWGSVVQDLRAVVARARATHEGLPVILLGHSMGSLLARTLVLDASAEVDGLVLSGTAGDPGLLGWVGLRIARAEKAIRGPRHRSTLMDRLTFAGCNKAFAPTRTTSDWLSRDPAVVDAYVADPACGAVFTTSFFTDLLGAVPAINDPRRIAGVRPDLPVLLVAGDADPVGGNGKGVREVGERYTEAGVRDVTVILYPQARHEIFNETNRDEVVADLTGWLAERFAEPQD